MCAGEGRAQTHHQSSRTRVPLLSLFAPPAISSISARDARVPVCSGGALGARSARGARRAGDAADEPRGALGFGLKQLAGDSVAQADHAHQGPHLRLCGHKERDSVGGPVGGGEQHLELRKKSHKQSAICSS